jgi:tetratricopeptide (TPR) repeat protein
LRVAHYITIAAAAGLIALLYFGGNTTPPPKKPEAASARPQAAGAMGQAPMMAAKAASTDAVLSASLGRITGKASDSVSLLNKELAATKDSARMTPLFTALSGVWERAGQLPAAAYYRALAAKLENSEKNLTFAGQFFLQVMENDSSSSMQAWEAGQAVTCLERALALNGGNEDTKLALATAYIEGTGEPMRGVQMLLAITREKPDDVPANMLLGRMSIQSGQYDKAVGRFETVLKKEPENKEALFFAAQAYEGKGDKQKAVELFTRCKKLVNDPGFSAEIDQRINSMK